MRWLLMLPIVVYWYCVPQLVKSRSCLFKETCSRFVYRTARENGLVAGVRALRERYSQCRPGYSVQLIPSGRFVVVLRGHVSLDQDDVNESVLRPYRVALKRPLDTCEEDAPREQL